MQWCVLVLIVAAVLVARLAGACPSQLLYINVKRFRGGIVFKDHRLFYHSTLGLRVIRKKEKRVPPGERGERGERGIETEPDTERHAPFQRTPPACITNPPTHPCRERGPQHIVAGSVPDPALARRLSKS